MNVRLLQKNALFSASPSNISPSSSGSFDKSSPPEEVFINYVEFNQDQTCFCVATQMGFSIFKIDPLTLRAQKKFSQNECSSSISLKNNNKSHKRTNSGGTSNSSKKSSPGHEQSSTSPKTSPRGNEDGEEDLDDDEDYEDIEDVGGNYNNPDEEALDDDKDESSRLMKSSKSALSKDKRRKSKISGMHPSSAEFSKLSVDPSFCGVGLIEPLFSSQYCALVGGGSQPFRTPKDLVIWNLKEQNEYHVIHFENEVLNVKLQKDLIIVVFEYCIRFYDLNLVETRKEITTIDNPKGIVAVNSDSSNLILACLGLEKGQVRIEKLSTLTTQLSLPNQQQSDSESKQSQSKILKIISAHQDPIECLALSKDGSILATASENGKFIKIFSTASPILDPNSPAALEISKQPLKTLQRGLRSRCIVSLAIRDDNKLLCCSSVTGTIHLFSIENKESKDNSGIDSNNYYFHKNNNAGCTEFYNQNSWFGGPWKSGETSTFKHHGLDQGSLVCFKPLFTTTKSKSFSRSPSADAPDGRLFSNINNALSALNNNNNPDGLNGLSNLNPELTEELKESLKEAEIFAITPKGVFHRIKFFSNGETKVVSESFYEQLFK